MASSPNSDDQGSNGTEKYSHSPLPSTVDEARLLRKIDLKVMPMLFVIYVAAFLDRLVLALLSRLICTKLNIESIYRTL